MGSTRAIMLVSALLIALLLVLLHTVPVEGRFITIGVSKDYTTTEKAVNPGQPHFIGRELDVYTQHQHPYGGQGKNMSSDSFGPQDLVMLFANVTYIGILPQRDLVTFEIHSPQGDYDAYRLAPTNASGIANVSFRIPDPIVGHEEKVFGEWKVTAYVPLIGDANDDRVVNVYDLIILAVAYGSKPGDPKWDSRADLNEDLVVDIYDLVVVSMNYGQVLPLDTLTFKVGWIIELSAIETCDESGNPKKVFARGEEVYFNITLNNISMRDKNATVLISLYDELEFPIGSTSHFIVVPPDTFIVLLIRSIIVPGTAVVGEATAYANTFTASHLEGGTAYCPEISADFFIIA